MIFHKRRRSAFVKKHRYRVAPLRVETVWYEHYHSKLLYSERHAIFDCVLYDGWRADKSYTYEDDFCTLNSHSVYFFYFYAINKNCCKKNPVSHASKTSMLLMPVMCVHVLFS